MPSELAPSDDLLWKQYALHIDLYKFYLDLTIKVNVFYYAITGAIVSYYFQNAINGVAKYALGLPISISLALGGILWYGSFLVPWVREEVFAIRDRLGLTTAPELRVLTVFLRVMGSIQIAAGFGLGWFLIFRA